MVSLLILRPFAIRAGNTRTTAACAGKEVKDSQGKVTGGTGSLNDGLRVAFKAGSVMGFVVVGAISASRRVETP